MVISTFVAGRNSRHRAAVFALYRALVREGSKIPLPPDAQPQGSPSHNPVAQLVRRRFTKHRPYLSFRLIYNAMAAGYKFLTLFAQAQKPGSVENAQVADFLRARRKAAAATRAALPPRPAPTPRPAPRGPLLTNVAEPGQQPYYISTVRPTPRDAFEGERRAPVLAGTSVGMPYLRTKKPQSQVLSKIIGLKTRGYQQTMELLKDVDEYQIPDSALEDQWEKLVEAQMRAESLPVLGGADKTEASYVYSAQLARLATALKVEVIWQDWVARGEAFQRIVDEERALAAQERGETAQQPQASAEPRAPTAQHAKVEVAPPLMKLALEHAAASKTVAKEPPAEDPRDTYASPSWKELVRRRRPQLIRDTKNTHNDAPSARSRLGA